MCGGRCDRKCDSCPGCATAVAAPCEGCEALRLQLELCQQLIDQREQLTARLFAQIRSLREDLDRSGAANQHLAAKLAEIRAAYQAEHE